MKTLTGYRYYPDSLKESGSSPYFLVCSEEEDEKYLGNASGFEVGHRIAVDSGTAHLFPLAPENAYITMREAFEGAQSAANGKVGLSEAGWGCLTWSFCQ